MGIGAASVAADPIASSSLAQRANVTEASSILEESIIISLCGVDIVGGDIWNARHPGPDACVANCRPETGCDAATWTNYQGGTCWFKRVNHSWASAVPSVGSVSFVRTIRNIGRYMGPDFPPNVDMPGNDIGNSPGKTEYDCQRPCDHSAYCFGYTWTNYNGGTCWFKSRASPFVYSPGTVARFKSRETNPDTCFAMP
jgi:hypothetical protein